MNVSELISKLRALPQDLEVIVYATEAEEHGYEVDAFLVDSREKEAYDKGERPSRLGVDFPYVRIGCIR